MKKSVNQKETLLTPFIHTPSSEKDRCVLCWGETEYSKNTPIEDRQFYIEGAGQLCEECYRKYRYCSEQKITY